MTETCGKYSKKQISRYIDGELPRHQLQQIQQHLDTCPACRDLVAQFLDVSRSFNEMAELPGVAIDLTCLYQTMGKPVEKSAKPWTSRFFSKPVRPFLATAVSIAALFFISVYAPNHDETVTTGPSAIVTSINTDYTAVMILETPDTHHTIIWYSET
ncbi:MAG: zf-HC2 domain-containing protein [Desulfotignum sp.]|jgi:anti-sigma factor RsiW|nr:zf-HC2 domain-containing protein [Desulfotignum sp.]